MAERVKRIILCSEPCHHVQQRHREGEYECASCDCLYFTFGGVLVLEPAVEPQERGRA